MCANTHFFVYYLSYVFSGDLSSSFPVNTLETYSQYEEGEREHGDASLCKICPCSFVCNNTNVETIALI